MSIFEAVILGLVQGFAEFLPISSSGHLILFQKLLKLEEPSFTYDILLHIATLIPVIIVFKDDIISLIKRPFQKTTYFLILGTLPVVICALLFEDKFDSIFLNGQFLWIAFIVTGFILLYAEKTNVNNIQKKDMTYTDALIVGVIQAFAVIPGISRSGSTIAGSLSRNLSREAAAKFSFLLSIPAIIGAFVFQLFKIFLGRETASVDLLPMSAGFIVAALSGYLAINFMLEIIKKCKLKYFSYYLFIVAFFVLIDKLIFGRFF